MPDTREIYRFHAEDYDALVRCEDREGNLLKAIRDVVVLDGADVVELGAGTGRLTAHQTVWNAAGWREPIEAAVHEMFRVLRPHGTAIVIETLGTGHTTPRAPSAELERYYAVLTEDFHFERTWLRTDYQFSSMAEGERLVRFFGKELAEQFRAAGTARVS